MIIEIKDFPLNVKRVVLEFDDSGACVAEPETKVKNKSRNDTKIDKVVKEPGSEPALDINFGSKPVKTANTEPIDKVVIPDIEREANVSSTMQNLKL